MTVNEIDNEPIIRNGETKYLVNPNFVLRNEVQRCQKSFRGIVSEVIPEPTYTFPTQKPGDNMTYLFTGSLSNLTSGNVSVVLYSSQFSGGRINPTLAQNQEFLCQNLPIDRIVNGQNLNLDGIIEAIPQISDDTTIFSQVLSMKFERRSI